MIETPYDMDCKLTRNILKQLCLETTWRLIGFHGNDSQINDDKGGRHLGFLNIQILFKFKFL